MHISSPQYIIKRELYTSFRHVCMAIGPFGQFFYFLFGGGGGGGGAGKMIANEELILQVI